MTDYSEQHFTFKKHRIYPTDWIQTQPYSYPDAVDSYYSSLANRVATVILLNPLVGYFDEDREIQMAAIHITGWFEDICSEIGIWRCVTDEFQKRYGRLLPFYDLEDYCPGEVNVQDLRFLLWDFIQSIHRSENRIINPENPYIESCAEVLNILLKDEYENAPINERLFDFVHTPDATENIWEARGLMSWLFYRSYIGFYQKIRFDEAVNEAKYEKPELRYAAAATFNMVGRENILSLTATQWLSRIRKDRRSIEVFSGISFVEMEPYRILSFKTDGMEVINLYSDRRFLIDKESFISYEDLKRQFKDKDATVSLSVLHFDGRDYMCGSMLGGEKGKELDKKVADEKEMRENRKQLINTHNRFIEVNRQKPYAIFKDADELKSFFTKKMQFSENSLRDFLGYMSGLKNFILFSDPQNGFISIPNLGACIASKSNKLYDKQYAKENAHSLLINSDVGCYKLSCLLQDKKLLPDAKLNSTMGEAHGRKLIHNNSQFFIDYFFSCNREDDYDQ